MLVDDDDERDAARRLVERRITGMSRLDRVTATRRLIGMLARKGYNGGLASAVVREVVEQAGLPAPPDRRRGSTATADEGGDDSADDSGDG